MKIAVKINKDGLYLEGLKLKDNRLYSNKEYNISNVLLTKRAYSLIKKIIYDYDKIGAIASTRYSNIESIELYISLEKLDNFEDLKEALKELVEAHKKINAVLEFTFEAEI